ncbi:MAG TPA: isoprenylcysteine carboxylmethyltransferase family protein [Lachnospiraceae bacterium]|nr:isoprenylcysteine carboxylmethyltransferase family protein [Lachnospiraceae bacterium]
METTASHYGNWIGAVLFIVLYSLVLLFIPFYKKMDRKPKTAFVAFVCAFAIEMFGIPFSFYIVSWLIGKSLPEGFLWGHTLISQIGFWGMYLNYLCIIIAAILIINGWYNIYHKYWKKEGGTGAVVKTGVYKYIRHPQYTGFFLLTLGMILEWATIPMLIMWPVILVMYYRLAKKEEADMVKEFGEEYIEYRKQTKMFMPFIF